MRYIDTNIVVRLITEDDERQFGIARRELDRGDLMLSMAVIVETEWVLRGGYRWTRVAINRALRAFTSLAAIHVEDEAGLSAILDDHEHGMDLADALHLLDAQRGRAEAFLTFDRDLARCARNGAVTVSLLS